MSYRHSNTSGGSDELKDAVADADSKQIILCVFYSTIESNPYLENSQINF